MKCKAAPFKEIDNLTCVNFDGEQMPFVHRGSAHNPYLRLGSDRIACSIGGKLGYALTS